MKNMVSIIFSTLLLLPYTNAFSEKDTWTKGALDCGDFLASCDASLLNVDCQAQTAWALGFISGVTNATDLPWENTSPTSLKYALIKYCRENPLKSTYSGTVSIHLKLIK